MKQRLQQGVRIARTQLRQTKKWVKPVVVLATVLACATAAAQLAPSEPPVPPVSQIGPQDQVNLKGGNQAFARLLADLLAAFLQGRTGFGQALPGLTAAELTAFEEGRVEFTNVETPAAGLGPIFNGVSCIQCHAAPAIGGGSRITVTRFGRVENGVFDPLDALGGSLLQPLTIFPQLHETIPPQANVVAERISPPLFGLGLIEAIPDATLIANAAAPKPDGVKGRAALVTDVVSGQTRVGRFGWKAQQATLLAFSADAYNNEMGITNRFFPNENAPNGNQELLRRFTANKGIDDTVGPDGRSDIDAAADFIRFLAAPPTLTKSASALTGETLFIQSGCATCHTPTLRTGPNSIAALDRRNVNLYSDLLLHDMGTLGDGIGQADAGMREMRTAPLWGIRARDRYLHDGRAHTIDAAIRAHEGEGSVSRDRYTRLSPRLRQSIVDFLGTL
ncbi:hypothetical protein AEM42_02670 [Betaproteobacteria bacterium UKL13-2]|jgi:CxxC motif-containing protein (DUF1111 family)|nr:hypothetical protein AEM42_02670 [Betaproteobacteria bacterium UKL13-2]HCG54380.1 hypothetical protein [Betaproteobacteria bacterium]